MLDTAGSISLLSEQVFKQVFKVLSRYSAMVYIKDLPLNTIGYIVIPME
jgi:hypothetical protein